MEVKWLIEDYEADSSLEPMIAEVKSQGMECKVLKYVPFRGGEYDDYLADDCVVFYGSLNLAFQLQRQKPWVPGPICNFKNMCCLTYYSHWGHLLFNRDYIMLPLLEVSRRRKEIYDRFGVDDCIFMRPDSGAKTFYGAVYPLDELDSELKLMDGYAGRPIDEILVVVSTPKSITREWRIVVEAGVGPIAATQYKNDGKLDEKEGCPDGGLEIARMISQQKWQPDRMYIVDVCESNGEFHFLEVNSFSCSGLYACSVKPIVKIVSEIAIKEWKEYNEI